MSYSIRFEDRKDYLYAYVEGQDSLETSMNYMQEVADKALAGEFQKLLIEENLEGQLKDFDMFQITSKFVDMGLAEIKMGFVDLKEDHSIGNEFGELVATNRGVKVKIFNTVADAEAWLLGNK